MLRNNSSRGGLACFVEIVWARVPGTRLLRGKYEVNWPELVWLGKTENTEEHLCGDEHGVRKFRTVRRQPESARWRRELVGRLTGEPFNPKPKSSTVADSCKLPVDLQWSERVSPNVNVDEAPKDQVTQKRWYVTEALVNEHGRTMGCPRCSSGIGMHNAECRGRIEGILLQQSRMKPTQEEEPRSGGTTTKPAAMEAEKPTGPTTQHGRSSGSGVKRNDVASPVATRSADEQLPEVPDVVMDAEDSCEAPVKRERQSWVWTCACWRPGMTSTMRLRTNLAGMSTVNTTDEDVVGPEVTEELNRLKLLGRPYTAPTVDELMPRGPLYSHRTNEQLDDRMVAEGRKRELATLSSQDAWFVIARMALRPGTRTVRGRLVDDMKNDRVKSRFVAAEVARDVRHGDRACEHRRGRGSDSPRRTAGKRRVLPVAEGTQRYSDGFKAVAATPHESAQNAQDGQRAK